jgi:putative addiction module killer protein
MILRFYTRADGVVPFREWVLRLRDKQTRFRINQRLSRLRLDNLGDHKSIGGGLWELRLDFGPGFRIYYGVDDQTVIVLLSGGDKSTQAKDIRIAREHWQDYLRRKEEK